MSRPGKEIKRFGCKLTEKTYNDVHQYAVSHRMTISGLIELAIIRYIQKPVTPDYISKMQRRKKGIPDIPYTFNLPSKVYADMHKFVEDNKEYKITLSGVTESAIIEFMEAFSHQNQSLPDEIIYGKI